MKIKSYFIFLISLTVCLNAFSQKTSSESQKASLLYYISNLIEWPNDDSLATFNIGVLSPKNLINEELGKLSKDYTVHGKPVIIKSVGEFEEPKDIQLLFVDDAYHRDIADIMGYCQEYQIVQVTDELKNKKYTVINFVEDLEQNDVGFEVNRKNLDNTNITYKDELLLYGGSLNDLRDLYMSTKKLLDREVKKVYQLNIDINRKNFELIEKESLLARKNSAIDSLSTEIDVRRDSLDFLSGTLLEQMLILNRQDELYNKTQRRLALLQSEKERQLADIERKEQELLSLDSKIHDKEALISSQTNLIQEQSFTIESKNRWVLYLSLLGGGALLLGLLIFRAYRLKNKYNQILEQRVLKRTKKLQEINDNLNKEINLRTESERELKKVERNYLEIFNATSDAIITHNLNGDILNVNNAMIEMYGYSEEQLGSIHYSDLCSQNENYSDKEAQNYMMHAQSSGKIVFDWQAKRSNGEIFWVEIALTTTHIEGKDCLLSVIRDIDEKKKSAMILEDYRMKLEQMVDERTIELKDANEELNTTNRKLHKLNQYLKDQKKELEFTLEQLQQTQNSLVESEKMATIGILAAGVAHEINNPLNYIRGGVSGIKSILERQNIADNMISELMEGVDSGVDKASKIVSSLNHFSRQSEVLDEKCDIHSIIDNCLELSQHNLKYRIQVVKEFCDKNIVCYGNEGKIHQVILNVLTNASQAIDEEGTIKISTALVEGNKNLLIKINDTGSGIPRDILDKITTPFFTTKEPGKGTGLGLAISNKIITDHGGELLFESELNKGTTVKIYLPNKIN